MGATCDGSGFDTENTRVPHCGLARGLMVVGSLSVCAQQTGTDIQMNMINESSSGNLPVHVIKGRERRVAFSKGDLEKIIRRASALRDKREARLPRAQRRASALRGRVRILANR